MSMARCQAQRPMLCLCLTTLLFIHSPCQSGKDGQVATCHLYGCVAASASSASGSLHTASHVVARAAKQHALHIADHVAGRTTAGHKARQSAQQVTAGQTQHTSILTTAAAAEVSAVAAHDVERGLEGVAELAGPAAEAGAPTTSSAAGQPLHDPDPDSDPNAEHAVLPAAMHQHQRSIKRSRHRSAHAGITAGQSGKRAAGTMGQQRPTSPDSLCGNHACDPHLPFPPSDGGPTASPSSLPRYSLHSCFGETTATRSCLFRNLYMRMADRQLVYFECEQDPPRVKVAGQRLSTTQFGTPVPREDPYFFERDFIKWPLLEGPEYSFTPQVVRGPAPPSDQVKEVPGLTVVWDFLMQSNFSFGHCLLNDWLPLFLNLHAHSPRLPRHFQLLTITDPDTLSPLYNPNSSLVPVSDLDPRFGQAARHVCAHYLENWTKSPVLHLPAFLQRFKQTPWIRFCDLVLGEGGYWRAARDAVEASNPLLPLQPSPLYSTPQWRLFRDSMYRVFDVGRVKEARHSLRIVVVDKPPSDNRRRILNVPELVSHLRKAFPEASTTSVEFGGLTPVRQLQLLRQTTVLIATQGSAAFRFVFLDDSARSICIGTPLDDEGPSTNNWNWTPFFEIPRYFAVGHFKFLKYIVDPSAGGNSSSSSSSGSSDGSGSSSSESSTFIEWEDTNPQPNWGQHWRAYNANVRVNVTKMEALVRQALWEYKAEVAWRASMHADTLRWGG